MESFYLLVEFVQVIKIVLMDIDQLLIFGIHLLIHGQLIHYLNILMRLQRHQLMVLLYLVVVNVIAEKVALVDSAKLLTYGIHLLIHGQLHHFLNLVLILQQLLLMVLLYLEVDIVLNFLPLLIFMD